MFLDENNRPGSSNRHLDETKKSQARQWITYDAYYAAADIAGEQGLG
jgi:hypothetical protein